MLDPEDFDLRNLVGTLLEAYGNQRVIEWRCHADIVAEDGGIRVKYGDQYLRHSKGPLQHHFWDLYGDDYQTRELAFVALLQAPVPPSALRFPLGQEGGPR